MPRTDAADYTIEKALKDATRMLADEFGNVDQKAAVSLATFLYGTKMRDEFLRAPDTLTDETPYGAPGL